MLERKPLKSLGCLGALWTLLILAAWVSSAAVLYVDLNSTNSTVPYSNWAAAAVTIQDAVDAASAGDLILVGDGRYGAGGRAVYGTLTNRVAVTKPITVQSVNGPAVTIIEGRRVLGTTNGNGAFRCAYLTNGATLSGFTLTNGATRNAGDYYYERSGGGVWCSSTSAVVTNCVLIGNTAAAAGGGVHFGRLNNCTLAANVAGRPGIDPTGGGAYHSALINCTLTGNSAYMGGGAEFSSLTNCTLSANVASSYGGGACNSTLDHCTLVANSAAGGGGAYECHLSNCLLSTNSGAGQGGGAYNSELNYCTLTSNYAGHGGANYGGTLIGCRLIGNSSGYEGGGDAHGELDNCALIGNTARVGGAAYQSFLYNCTVVNNSASFLGGGTFDSHQYNSILCYNTAAVNPNYFHGTLDYCCTTPLPSSGVGNLQQDPQLADWCHLTGDSPCRGAGSAYYACDADIDGEGWANLPSIGCDEFAPDWASGALSVTFQALYTNLVVGFECPFAAVVDGRASASTWDFGDGTIETNRLWTAHTWRAPGDYAVVLRAYNSSHLDGMAATGFVHVVVCPQLFVSLTASQPQAPYDSWATAATNIQDAIDAATAAGSIVLVSNGAYSTGGRVVYGVMTNRVALTKPVVVQSVGGPAATFIVGGQATGGGNGDAAVRCAYLTDRATLSGFTLTNGATRAAGDVTRELNGGGAWCASALATISNCVITGNSASWEGAGAFGGTLQNCVLTRNPASRGGGACIAVLNNCVLVGNSSANGGGGAAFCGLNNCTLVENSAAMFGGGADRCVLNNCLAYYNSAPGGNCSANFLLRNCCTTPLPSGNDGNFTNEPLVMDLAGGDLRLQSNSPCINSGYNASAPAGLDLDGNARVVNGTVDVGAYEFQGIGSLISYAWLQQYGLPTDSTSDASDPDADGMSNQQEWLAGTDPTNAASVLRINSLSNTVTGATLSWQSVDTRTYFVQCATNLLASPVFFTIQSNLVGQAGTTSFTHTPATNGGPVYYRIGVQ